MSFKNDDFERINELFLRKSLDIKLSQSLKSFSFEICAKLMNSY